MQEKLLQELLTTASQLYAQGEFSKADEITVEVLKAAPSLPQALHLRGLIFHMSGDIVSAIKLVSEATAIEPTNTSYLTNLCAILIVAGQVAQAIEVGRRAVALDDTNPGTLSYLAHALTADHQYDAALAILEKIASLPYLSLCYLSQGLTCARRVADFSATHVWLERITNYFSSPETSPLGNEPTGDLFNLAYADVPAPLPLGIYVRVIRELEARLQSAPLNLNQPPPPRTHSQRIKIGYLSAGFGDNPIGHVIHGLFRHHDRSRFEVHIFSSRNRDHETASFAQTIREECEQFHNVSQLSSRDAALKIRQAGIDILIYIDGFLSTSGSLIVAQRPAARQYFWLGHAGTLGLSCIDATIADTAVLPLNERSGDECFIDLAGCYHCASPLEAVEFVDPILHECQKRLQGEQSLSALPFVFCGFNNPEKITVDVFRAWMEILRAVPYSVLWLSNQFKSTALENNLRSAAHDFGVDGERLVFAGRIASKKEHLGRHKQADLLLDTFSHNAATTALDALLMGVPIVTLKGHRFASRICSDFLTNLNLSELICSSPSEYVQKAIALAQDPAACNALKIKVAAAVKSSELFKPEQFVRKLEAAIWPL